MGVNQEARAAKAWVVLVHAAENHRSLTYTDLGDAIGIHHRHLSKPLGFLQDYCLDAKVPPLTILVHQKGGRHGSGFIAWDIDNIENGFEQVFAFHWQGLRNPFAYALVDDETQATLAKKLLDVPDGSEDVYLRVADRGIAQHVFRAALLRAYDNACAFCGFSFHDALEAAHIVSWTQCSSKDRMNVRNGLLLCATHHRLFDRGWMSVTEQYVMVHRRAEGPYDRFDTLLTSDLHEQKIRLPRRPEHRPDPTLLRERARLWKEALDAPEEADEDA